MREWYFDKSGSRDGPHSDEELIALARAGTVRDHTLVWTQDLGATWKPFAQSALHPLLRPVTDGVPALPTTQVSGVYAWLYAFVPLIGAVIEQLIAVNANTTISFSRVIIVYTGVYGLLAYYDHRLIERSGNAKVPDTRWFLLAPAYLWARARALGQKQIKFAVMMACFVLAVLIDDPSVRAQFFLGMSLPVCNSTYANDEVSSLFASVARNKLTGLTAVQMSGQREISHTDKMRTCAASVEASDTNTYPITYSFEQRSNDVYVRIQVQ